MTASGRVATDTSPDSSSESRRWRFASRKLPLADESCRPAAAVELLGKLSFNVRTELPAVAGQLERGVGCAVQRMKRASAA